jgi:hypothetical protein
MGQIFGLLKGKESIRGQDKEARPASDRLTAADALNSVDLGE